MSLSRLRFSPFGWLLVGIAGLALVIAVGFYAMTAWGGTRIDGDPRPDHGDAYHWSGEKLILEVAGGSNQVTCTVTPESGESREVVLFRQPSGSAGRRQYEELDPWFSGSPSATTVSCDGDARAWSGAAAARYAFVQSSEFRYGGGGIVAMLLLIALGFCRRQPADQPRSASDV